MKNGIFLLVSVLFLSLTAAAQPAEETITVKLQKGTLTINRSAITPDWQVGPVIGYLGKNNKRTKPGFNITHTYDDYGIVLFEPTATDDKIATGNLSEFQVYLSEPNVSNNVVPNGVFYGTMMVEGMRLTRSSTASQVREKLLGIGYAESNSYSVHNFRFAKNGVYMYVLFNEDEDRLIKVSLGKDKSSN